MTLAGVMLIAHKHMTGRLAILIWIINHVDSSNFSLDNKQNILKDNITLCHACKDDRAVLVKNINN